MPTLEELYKKHMHTMAQGFSAAGRAFVSPLKTSYGMFEGAGKIAQGLGQTLLDIPQAFSKTGYKFPGSASGAIVPAGTIDPKWGGNPTAIPEWEQRVGLVGNALTLGALQWGQDAYGRTGSIDSALIDMGKTALPVHEVVRLYSGESPSRPGELMTPEEWGENLLFGALKAVPMMKGIGKIYDKTVAGTTRFSPTRHVMSATEIAEGKKTGPLDVIDGTVETVSKQSKIDELVSLQQKAIEIRNQLPKEALPETKLSATLDVDKYTNGLLTELGISTAITKKLFGGAPTAEVAQAFVDSVLKVGTGNAKLKSVTELFIDVMQTPGGRASLMDVIEKHGITPEQAAASYVPIMDALRTKMTGSGQVMQAASDFQRRLVRWIDTEGNLPPETYAAFKSIQKALDLTNEPTTLYQKMVNTYRNVNDIWRGAAVSSPVTSNRNMQVGMGVFVSSVFDSTMVGAETYGIGQYLKATGQRSGAGVATMADAMFPTINRLTTMQQMLFGGEKTISGWLGYMSRTSKEDRLIAPIAKVLDLIQTEYSPELTKMFTGAINDLHTINLMADGLRGYPGRIKSAWKNVETPMDAARFATSLLNTLNTSQELFWRKYFFVSRMNENMHRFGYKNPQEFIAKLQQDKGFGPEYFGKPYTSENLTSFIDTSLATKLQEAKQSRLDVYGAQTGQKLHKTETDIANIKHQELAQTAQKQLMTAKDRLAAGEDWQSIANKLDPEVARLLEGRIDHASSIITDAADTALKNTFAYTPPKGNMGYALLKMYDEFPFLYTLGSPFPRFAINSMNWIMEHTGADLVKLASPAFRKTLNDIAVNPRLITDPKVIQQFEAAHTGAALWAGAHYIARYTDLTGPKYYQLRVGKDEKNNPIYADMRPYQPFVQYMFLEQVVNDIAQNKIPNLTAAELTEAVTGMRRLSEVPIFAFPDIIRQIDSSNPEAFVNSLKPLIGQTVAGMFTPFRTIGDIAGALGVDSAVTQKDVSGNELIGPSLNQFPVLREALPDRIDPFTGQIGSQQHPSIRMLGPNLRSMSKLEQEISKTGIPLNDLLGNYSDPEADRLVRKYIGQTLGRASASGGDMASQLGNLVESISANKPNEFRSTAVRELYTQLRKSALQQAMTENPFAFIEHSVRQRPEVERPILRDMLKKYKTEAVKRQIQGNRARPQ